MALLLTSELRALQRYILESDSSRQAIRIAAGRNPETSGPLMRAYRLVEEALTGYSASRISAQDANAADDGNRPDAYTLAAFHDLAARQSKGRLTSAAAPVLLIGTLYNAVVGDPSDRPLAVGRVLMRGAAFQVVGLQPGLPWSDTNQTFHSLDALEKANGTPTERAKVVLGASVVSALLGRPRARTAPDLTPDQIELLRTWRDPR